MEGRGASTDGAGARDTPSTREEPAVRDLARKLDHLCDAQPFQTSWYLKDLASGASAHRLGGVPVPSASTRKISILMAALHAVRAGRVRLDQRLTVEARYQDNDSGTFQHLTPGFWVTLRDALVMMIIVSDNACTGLVCDLVGLPEIQRYCEEVGLTGTIHRFGIPPRLGPDHTLEQVTVTTPSDQGLLLELILRGTDDPAVAGRLGVTPELCRLALDILSWQKLKTRLPALLPLGTKVAHKTGTGARGFMDAGIVFRGADPLFILTAYTDRVPAALPDGTPGFAAAYQLIARMARAAWDALPVAAPVAEVAAARV
jgi:beta-lactamase class A